MKIRRSSLIVLAITIILISVMVVLVIDTFKSKGDSSKDDLPWNSEPWKGNAQLYFLSRESMEFTYVTEKEANESLLSGKPKYEDGVVWWEELSADYVQEFGNTYNISPPEVDFNMYSIVFSIGRKIVEIRSFKFDAVWGSNSRVAIVTFSEEYFENTIFFYAVRRVDDRRDIFLGSELMSPSFIMKGDGELYLGENLFNLPKETKDQSE